MNNAELWYTAIPGPSRLVNKIAETLSDNKTVILHIDYDFPWRNEMRNAVEVKLRDYPHASSINFLDVTDQYQENNPARFVVHQFCSEEDYAFASKESQAIQTLKSGVLQGRIVWFKGIPDDRDSDFISFCRTYKTFGKEQGVFVIETREDILEKSLPASIVVIDSSKYISENDVLIFVSILYAQRQEDDQYGKYFSNLVSILCGTDAELAAELIDSVDFHTVEPLDGLISVQENAFMDSERGVSPKSDPSHPFALLKDGNLNELQSRVWLAQMRVIMAAVERERQQFISKNSEELQYCYDELLHNRKNWSNVKFKVEYDEEDEQNYLMNQFDEFIRDIYDFEVNHLIQLTQITRKDEDGELIRLLVVPYKQYQRLELLRDIRNSLAHISCCSHETIGKLLSRLEFCSEK